MKKLLLGAVALACAASSAIAADLPVKTPLYKAPPPVPICNWWGFYVGVNAGGTWSRNDVQTIGTPVFAAASFAAEANVAAALATNSVAAGQAGFIGGGQIGYNYEQANYV